MDGPRSAAPYEVSPASSIDDLRHARRQHSAVRSERSRSSLSSRGSRTRRRRVKKRDAEVSSASELSDEDNDYTTDFTSPASSDSGPEDRYTDEVESFRDQEYPQLRGVTYLDTGGTTIPPKSLLQAHMDDMMTNLYGNPHSASTPSALSGHRIDAVREKVLRFFNADPDEWDLVFTANATASIKLVVECMRDHAANSNTPIWYGYHRDAHTSIVGARELAKMHRCFQSDEEVDIWINSGGLGGPRPRQIGLFAYPGQSNMTGRRLPLNWCGRIRKQIHKAATYTLLDAAALASTASIDLTNVADAPDFVAVSFYKIFGWPALGGLLVRKDSAHVLRSRKYFGGGTVDMVITINDTWHTLKEGPLHESLEDGTPAFLSIFGLDHAIDVYERLYGPNPMKFISHHTSQLSKQLYDGLSRMHHANGLPLCTIYKDPQAVYGDPTVQGATVAFNVQRADGTPVGYEDVENAADGEKIYLRSGSLCNPGGMATYLKWSPPEMRAAYAAGHRCSNPTQVVMGKYTGVVRASLGCFNTAADVAILLSFLSETYLDRDASVPLPAHPASSAASVRTAGPTTNGAGTARPSVDTTVSARTAPAPASATRPVPSRAATVATSDPHPGTPVSPSRLTSSESIHPPLSLPPTLSARKSARAALGMAVGMGMEIKVHDLQPQHHRQFLRQKDRLAVARSGSNSGGAAAAAFAAPPPIPGLDVATSAEYLSPGAMADVEGDGLSATTPTSTKSRRRFQMGRGMLGGLVRERRTGALAMR